MRTHPYERLLGRKRKWSPVKPTVGKLKDGSEDTIRRALAVRHMELPVGAFITEGLEKTVPENARKLLEDNVRDEERHDLALGYYVDALGADDQADEITIADNVVLTVNTNSHREVMAGIIQAINGSKNGVVVVADTVTTNTAGTTVDKVYVHGDITGFGGYTSDTNATGIACVAVHAGS